MPAELVFDSGIRFLVKVVLVSIQSSIIIAFVPT